jgi:hypothetical protein
MPPTTHAAALPSPAAAIAGSDQKEPVQVTQARFCMLALINQYTSTPRARRYLPLLFPLFLVLLVLVSPAPRAGSQNRIIGTQKDSPLVIAPAADTPPEAHVPYNVYFLKIPKVGGTTLAVLFQNYARQFNLQLASPGPTRTVQTCQGRDGALKAWTEVKQRSPTGKFDIFISHGCFKPFMMASKQPEAWNRPDRQLKLTMFREPWSRVVSFYRYVAKCCEQNPPLEWCALQCSWAKTPERFLQHNCVDLQNCNQLYYYLRAQYPDDDLVLSRADAEKLLNDFDLIVVLEMLDESLVLLHMEYGIPFDMLPHINANANTGGKTPRISDKARTNALNRMQPDVILYDVAAERLRSKIANLKNKDVFEEKLAKLRAIQAQVKQQCADRWGQCLTKDAGVVSEGSCYYECVEQVTKDLPVQRLPFCSECQKYRKGCMTCTCNSDGGADCVVQGAPCLPLTLSHQCMAVR